MTESTAYDDSTSGGGPPLPHKVVIDDFDQNPCLYVSAEPSFDRRGTTVIYNAAAFGHSPLKDIH